jgi:hypothetical protein
VIPPIKAQSAAAIPSFVSITFTHRDGEMQQIEVTSPRRRCADLKCKGHDDGLDNYNFADR